MNAALIQRRALITLSLGLATGFAWPYDVPEAQAENASPNLEDAYLYFVGGKQ